MNDRREKKRGKSLGKAWKRADERTHLHVWRQRGRERGKGKYLQNEKGTKIFTARARMEFFSLSIFFSSLSGWKENIQTGEKVEKKKTPHTLNLKLLNYQRKESNIKICLDV